MKDLEQSTSFTKADLSSELKKTILESNSANDLSEAEVFFDNLITIEDLATVFKLAPKTIRNWVSLRKLPYVKIGRRVFFLKSSIHKWLYRKEKHYGN